MSAELGYIPPILKGIEHHLYVVELVGCGVKVGITANPQKRIRHHRKAADDHGIKVGRTWISGPHVEARANERTLIRLAGPTNKREYIAVDYDAAVDTAEKLAKTRATDEAREAEAAKAQRVSFFWPHGTTKEDVHRKVAEVFGL